MNISDVLKSENPTNSIDAYLTERIRAEAEQIAKDPQPRAEAEQVDGQEIVMSRPVFGSFSRRKLFGLNDAEPLVPNFVVGQETEVKVRRPRRFKKAIAITALLATAGAVAMPLLDNDSEPEQSADVPTTATLPVTTLSPGTTVFVETTTATTIDLSSGPVFAPSPSDTEAPVVTDPVTTPAASVAVTEATAITTVETLPPVNPYEGVDCAESKVALGEVGTAPLLAEHCSITMELLAIYNPGVDLATVPAGTLINLWPEEVAPEVKLPTTTVKPAPSSKWSVDNCPAPLFQIVSAAAGRPYHPYFISLGLSDVQVDMLLNGTNLPDRLGIKLSGVMAGDEFCAPVTAQWILDTYPSIAKLAQTQQP